MRIDLPIPTFQPIEPLLPSNTQDIYQEKMNQWLSDLDTLSLSRVPEREGPFLFSHINYQLESEKLGSRVLRRYSDFYWLWDLLIKRYPFRLIPHLPPKQFAAKTFEEERTRGLERFINAVVRHPTLGKDPVVLVFLSHPLCLRDWRQTHSVSLDDEFIRNTEDIQPLEKRVPLDWEDRIRRMKKRIERSLIQYKRMLGIMRHMVRFKKALGTDYICYSLTINDLVESDKDCLFQPCQGCPRLVQGQSQVAKSMQQAGMMLNREAVAVADNVINALVQQIELLESFRKLIERKETPHTMSNETLVSQMARYTHKPTLSPIQQREIFIRHAILSELSFIHKSQINLSIMYNRWVKDESTYANSWMDHWSHLEIFTTPMPHHPGDFL
ncbi:sorting nexin [Rhizopus stolonifer]|uniref:Sorting nexin MVP1 n=1 Tax=Rhizopus stolonifer TaxID=4846 RepID=A0A367IQG8_RHIST|nr:sorting nexin [Rhizopus stolonifer]